MGGLEGRTKRPRHHERELLSQHLAGLVLGDAGLKGDRSGTFWPFFDHMKGLIADGRSPRIIALENVVGTLTSHGGKDFAAICGAIIFTSGLGTFFYHGAVR